jgi:hypothetical protein
MNHIDEFLDLIDDRNYTQEWLFSSDSQNWERLEKKLSSYLLKHKNNSPSDVEDLVRDFLLHLAQKDVCRSYLKQGKKVKDSVIHSWFFQFKNAEYQKWGLDASRRTLTGAKSQAEIKKKEDFVKTLSNSKKISVSKDESDSSISHVDYYDDNEVNNAEEKIQASQVNDLIREKFKENFGQDSDYFFSLWETERDGKYPSRVEWAKEWKISYRQLTTDIYKCFDCIKGMGRDQFSI